MMNVESLVIRSVIELLRTILKIQAGSYTIFKDINKFYTRFMKKKHKRQTEE